VSALCKERHQYVSWINEGRGCWNRWITIRCKNKIKTYFCLMRILNRTCIFIHLNPFERAHTFFGVFYLEWSLIQTFVSQSEVTNDYTCNTSMLGTCNCPFKGESNLFRGSFFFCSFFIVLTRFLCSFLFFAYLVTYL
jgi:hypothetical protein